MKKANYLIPLLLMLALLFATTAYAHDFEVNGIYYNINGTTATVTYKGTSPYQYQDRYSGSVTIPATVTFNGTTYSITSIGSSAFYGCTSLTTVNIPNSVTYIGGVAFSGCSNLTTVNIPNSITSIGSQAFYNCSSLTNIYIPNSVISIGDAAFSGTTWYNNQPDGLVYAGLVAYKYKGSMPERTSITLKDGTKGIADEAFYYCSSLTNINIPNSVTAIGDFAFRECSGLTNIDIPNSVTNIGSSAFYGCSGLTTVNIPNSVTYIGGAAFSYCYRLTNINIPNSVTAIESSTFYYCTGLTNINIPNSVTSIGCGAFSECSNLTNINIPNSVTNIDSYAFEGTAWYNNQPDGLVYAGLVAYKYKGSMPEGTSITLKEGTTGIAGEAFQSCRCLTNINIPNSVIAIGYYAFENCSGLTNIDIPNSVTNIGHSAFYGCSSLSFVIIPNSISSIGYMVFSNCTNLTSINIPNSVTNIGNYAFSGCSSLTTINIPNSVTSIEDAAFYTCASLNNVYCFAVNPPECIYKYYYTTFSNYSATLHVPAASLAAYFTAPEWSKFENIVGDAVAPTGISISRDSVEIQSGEQLKLTATVIPANASCKDVNWYSTDTNVATVDNGLVIAVGYGVCDIIAYCMGMPAICHISVTNRINIGQQEAMLLPNHMLVLTPSAPAMPSGFTVSSSDPTVAAARVMNGKVQIVGIKEGTTTITVASSDDTAQPATCLVTVYTESGDLNSDGFVDISDVTSIIDYLLGGDETSVTTKNADVNGDGIIDISDVTSLINELLNETE